MKPDYPVFVEHSAPITFKGWEFGFGKLDEDIAEAVAEGMANTLNADPPHVWLPVYWPSCDGIGGPKVEDPLTVYIDLPFGDTEDRCVWAWSFSKMVDQVIEDHENWETRKIDDPDGLEVVQKLATALRAEVAKLEALIAVPEAGAN